MISIDQFPETSRVWLYQADRQLTKQEQELISEELNTFVAQWAAHGDKLFGTSAILENYFIALVIDESIVGASGCSIDTSVQFMKQLGRNFSIEFFNRMNILVEDNGVKKIVHFSELPNSPEAFIFNPMTNNLGELRSNWKIKVKDSAFV